MFTTIIVLSAATCGAALITGARVFGMRRIVKHSTKADVLFTGVVAFGLAGTLTGLSAAIIAGLMMALVLSALKALYRLTDAVKRGCARVKQDRQDNRGDEHNQNGWIYNQAPYVST